MAIEPTQTILEKRARNGALAFAFLYPPMIGVLALSYYYGEGPYWQLAGRAAVCGLIAVQVSGQIFFELRSRKAGLTRPVLSTVLGWMWTFVPLSLLVWLFFLR